MSLFLSGFTLFAQQGDDASGAIAAIIGLVVLLFELALIAAMIAGMWAAFAKAGKPGWAAIVPIYNMIVIIEIAKKPIWWILLLLIPCVNFVVLLLILIDFAKAYRQGAGFAIGLWLLPFVFYPMLGFGSARYQG